MPRRRLPRPAPAGDSSGSGGRACATSAGRDTCGSWPELPGIAMLELLPSRRKARFGDLDYDWEHSVDTTRSNVSFRTQLFTGSTARPYFASEPWLFEEIVRALPVDVSQFTFVDLGAGKGRALLMASDYPFQRIVGVEFMPDLCRAAQKNIAGYSTDRQQCRRIEAICMDARDFQFPARAAGGLSLQSFF